MTPCPRQFCRLQGKLDESHTSEPGSGQRPLARRIERAAQFSLLGWVAYFALTCNWSDPNRLAWSIGGLSMLASVGLFWAARCGRIDDESLSLLGRGYLLLMSLALAVVGFAVSPVSDSHGAVAWSAIWIAVYPMVSPAPPRQVVVRALLAASFTPVTFLAFAAFRSEDIPSLGSLLLLFAPVYLGAFVAVLAANHISRLQAEVQSAKQLGVYQLQERIAQGGMGEVWRARHHLLSRPAAVKLIKPKRLTDGREVVERKAEERFEREAQITASLKSPHTVELYDFGVTETGTFYYVMELLDGFNLEQLVTREGPLEPTRVVHILRQLLDSLAEAHQRGLVHRDIKPANISVSERGLEADFVKVLDFGLVQSRQRPSDQRANNDRIDGTPAYLAPEAITGSSPVDARTDLYAVGCVAYWMLTGHLVFDAKTPTRMAVAHVVEQPKRPSERLGAPLPAQLEALVMACLAKDPKERPNSALELVARLDEIKAAEGSLEQPRAVPFRRFGVVPMHA